MKIGDIVKIIHPVKNDGFTEEMRFEIIFIVKENGDIIVRLAGGYETGIYVFREEQITVA